MLQEMLIAGVVAIGLIAVGRAVRTEFALRRGRPHDAGRPGGTPLSPDAHSLPPEG